MIILSEFPQLGQPLECFGVRTIVVGRSLASPRFVETEQPYNDEFVLVKNWIALKRPDGCWVLEGPTDEHLRPQLDNEHLVAENKRLVGKTAMLQANCTELSDALENIRGQARGLEVAVRNRDDELRQLRQALKAAEAEVIKLHCLYPQKKENP